LETFFVYLVFCITFAPEKVKSVLSEERRVKNEECSQRVPTAGYVVKNEE